MVGASDGGCLSVIRRSIRKLFGLTHCAMVDTYVLRVLPRLILLITVIALPRVVYSATPADLSAELTVAAPQRAWRSIVLHHSATSVGDVASIDAAHRRNKDAQGNPWLGIGYHFVVGNGQRMADGEVRATFRWRDQLAGAHAGHRQQNEHGIGICLIGDFETAAPTPKQLESLHQLLKILSARYAITRDRVLRHQDVHATLCPGRMFPWEQVIAKLPEEHDS